MTPAEEVLKRVAREVVAKRLEPGTSARAVLPVMLAEIMNRTGVTIASGVRALNLAAPPVDWDWAARQCGLDREA